MASCLNSYTDPYFQVAKTGAEEAQKEINGSVLQEAPSQATAEEAQIQLYQQSGFAESRRDCHCRQRRERSRSRTQARGKTRRQDYLL